MHPMLNKCAHVAELVDALVLGTSAARRGGSSPSMRTKFFLNIIKAEQPFRAGESGTARAQRPRSECRTTFTPSNRDPNGSPTSNRPQSHFFRNSISGEVHWAIVVLLVDSMGKCSWLWLVPPRWRVAPSL